MIYSAAYVDFSDPELIEGGGGPRDKLGTDGREAKS